MKKEYSKLQLILGLLNVTALLVSNIVVIKQFEIGGIMFSGSSLTFPITFILSDIFSEVYGYKWSRQTCYLAFACNLLMSLIFTIVIAIPPAEIFTSQEALSTILGDSPRIMIASFVTFLLSDWANDVVFEKMRLRAIGHAGFKTRAILSSLVGSVVNIFPFYLIAFAGEMALVDMVLLTAADIATEMAYEVAIVPLTSIVMKKVSQYEGLE